MPAFELSPFHQLVIDNLEFLLNGHTKKLAIITPPRHGKTTLANVMAPAYALGRNPTETIISVSYGSELSETWGRRVRNILSDPAFHEVFPNCKLSPDSAAAYRFTTTAGGEYSAVGRGGPVTGRGASLLVLDDLIKDSSEANSETTCRGIIEWLQHVAFTRLTPDGRVVAISTRWSERDPMGWILQQHGWTVLHLPALAESAADPLGREIGQALWPSQYPVEALDAIRADVGSRVFQCLYQGNVAASQGAIFKRNWFRYYATPPEHFVRIIQSWDTAFKTGATNDYSVCATIGETRSGFYLLALYRAKIEFPELKRQVADQADFWKPSEIYVEDKASGQSLVQELKLSTSYPVIPVKIDRDKETRAAATTGYYESGKMFFPDPQAAPWVIDLEDELCSFPNGRFDDMVDAVSQALNRLRDTGGMYGLLDWVRKATEEIGKKFRDEFGRKPQPKPELAAVENQNPITRVEGFKAWLEGAKAPPCPACDAVCTIYVGNRVLHCNACGADDGISRQKPIVNNQCPVEGCGLPLMMSGGSLRCQNHGQVPDSTPVVVGMSRAQLRAHGGFMLRVDSTNRFGRFG